jgi:hypothetical protein
MTPDLLSERAEAGPYVHETEAEEHAKLERAGEAHVHWLLAEAAAYEAYSLRELLARWRGKR